MSQKTKNTIYAIFLVISAIIITIIVIRWFFLTSISGGCFGKTSITNVKLSKNIDCLIIKVNNCNGGIFEVTNNCKTDVFIGETKFPYDATTKGNFSFDITRDDDTKFSAVTSHGNFAIYKPDFADQIQINIKVGNEESTLSFTKEPKY